MYIDEGLKQCGPGRFLKMVEKSWALKKGMGCVNS